jgi:hypothetical protein
MKLFYNNIQTVIIIILITIIVVMQQCSGPIIDFNLFGKKNKQTDAVEGTVITKIETKWDTVKFDSLVYVPKWRVRVDTMYDTTIKDIDTLSILRDYYAKYFYTYTLDLDSFGNIVIYDTISKNMILARTATPMLYIPTTIITRDSLINKNEFYYGIGLAANKEQFSYLGGEILYRSKHKKIVSLGLGLNQNLQPVVTGRLMWKIGK